MSRSACVAMGYVMVQHRSQSAEEAYDFVLKARPVAPNIGFLKQLSLFDMMGRMLEGSSEAHQIFKNLKEESEKVSEGTITIPLSVLQDHVES